MRRLSGVLALALAAAPAGAHPLAPSLLEVRELAAGQVSVRWKTPLLVVPGTSATPVLPSDCVDVSPREVTEEVAALRTDWTARCAGGGLVGRQIGVRGLAAAAPAAVVRVVLADGRVAQGVVTVDAAYLTVPSHPRPFAVAWDYARLGVTHILAGPDHLLFVFGLVLLASSARRILATVTAFTLGHSLTLSAAVLGFVALPVRPIEMAIAASVFLLAVELARDPTAPTAMRRWPWAMAMLFGLLHGLGFAAALSASGLPGDEIPLALFAFNVGIEAGQAIFVVAVLALRAATGRLVRVAPAWAARIPVYVMGSLAAFWWIERTVALFR